LLKLTALEAVAKAASAAAAAEVVTAFAEELRLMPPTIAPPLAGPGPVDRPLRVYLLMMNPF
jgi:hypothetical protein